MVKELILITHFTTHRQVSRIVGMQPDKLQAFPSTFLGHRVATQVPVLFLVTEQPEVGWLALGKDQCTSTPEEE
jgi:hypothetical protein